MRLLLLTNDDGLEADGLRRLAETAAAFGEVWVAAPDGQRSAQSHSITLHKPIEVYPRPFPVPAVKAFACTGTPADCVRVGVRGLLPRKPDAVLSGVNFGYNAAADVQYSATVGAALEGAFQGCVSIALSEGTDGIHETTDRYLSEMLASLLDRDPGPGRIWNVNFPDGPLSGCRGVLRDRTVSRYPVYEDAYPVTGKLPGGGLRFEVDGTPCTRAEPGTDFRALLDGYVSVGTVANLG